MLEDIIASYKEKSDLDTVTTLADKYNIPPRSIISKLSALGHYKRKEYVSKQGTAPIKKEALINSIATSLDMNPELMECMEKCTKYVLLELDRRIKQLIDPKP